MKFSEVFMDIEPAVSPPARGAWIEIILQLLVDYHRIVAPRTGGVD